MSDPQKIIHVLSKQSLGHLTLVWVNFMDLQRLDERCEYLELEIFHVSDAIRPALNHPDFVVETLHESKRDFVMGTTVTDDALPMALDQLGKLLVRRKAAPLELRLPVVEEFPSQVGCW